MKKNITWTPAKNETKRLKLCVVRTGVKAGARRTH